MPVYGMDIALKGKVIQCMNLSNQIGLDLPPMRYKDPTCVCLSMINNSFFRLRVYFHEKCMIIDDGNQRKITDALLTSPT